MTAQVVDGSDPGDAAAADAAEVRAFLASLRGGGAGVEWRTLAYRIYVTVLYLGFYSYVVFRSFGGNADAGGARTAAATVDGATLAAVIVGAACVLLLAGVQVSVWAGPVALDPPGSVWLLPSPVRHRAVLRPALVRGIAVGAAIGGLLGLLVVPVLHAVRPGLSATTLLTSPLAGALLGTFTMATAWFVEASATVGRRVHRGSALLWLAAVGLSLLVTVAPGSVWAGPWGWAAAPLLDAVGVIAHGTLIGLVLLAAAATAAVVLAVRHLPEAPDEELLARTGVHRASQASLQLFDAQSLGDMRRSGVRRFRRTPRSGLRPPPWRLLLPLWIDVLSLWRRRDDVTRSVGLATATVVLVAARPDALAVVAVSAVLAYFAASALLRDVHRAVALPLGPDVPTWALALGCLVVPTVLLWGAGLVGIAVALVTGLLASHQVGPAAVGVLIASPAMVVAAGVAATRGSPPLHWLLYIDVGYGMLLAWLLVGPLLALLLGLPLAVVATHADELHSAVTSALTSEATVLIPLTAVFLWRATREA